MKLRFIFENFDHRRTDFVARKNGFFSDLNKNLTDPELFQMISNLPTVLSRRA